MTSSLKLFFPYILILYYIKQIDSKLPCFCSVIDNRGRQNAITVKKLHALMVTDSVRPKTQTPLDCFKEILNAFFLVTNQ